MINNSAEHDLPFPDFPYPPDYPIYPVGPWSN